jgi:hypothetical protein
MSLILPKGIVVNNSPEIEGSIERFDTEPLDLADIAKFWKGTAEKPPCQDGIKLISLSVYYYETPSSRSYS